MILQAGLFTGARDGFENRVVLGSAYRPVQTAVKTSGPSSDLACQIITGEVTGMPRAHREQDWLQRGGVRETSQPDISVWLTPHQNIGFFIQESGNFLGEASIQHDDGRFRLPA